MAGEVSQQLIGSHFITGSMRVWACLHGQVHRNYSSNPDHADKTYFSVAGTLTHFHVKLNGSPGAGNAHWFRVYKNGSPTNLAAYVYGDETEKSDYSTVSISPGDWVSVRHDPISNPSQRIAHMTAVFFPTNMLESNLSSQGDSLGVAPNNGVASGFIIGGGCNGECTKWVYANTMVRNCNLSDFRLYLETAYPVTYTVYKNEVATDLSVTISGGETEGYDLAHQLPCVAGDRIMIWRDSGAAVVCFAMKRTETGYLSFNIGGTPHWLSQSGQISIMAIQGSTYSCMVNECVMRGLHVGLRVAPGEGNSRTFTVVKGGVETDLSVTISDDDTEGIDGHWIWFEKGDIVQIKYSISGSPSTPRADISWGVDIISLVGLLLPSVVTGPCTDRTLITTTANGYITFVGGYYVATRGFCYKKGTTGDPTVEDSTVSEDGEYLTGAYSLGITGLESGEDYRVRAYVIGPKGIAYGETVTCSVTEVTPNIRVSSIRRIYQPGLYRMELGVGDLAIDPALLDIPPSEIPEEVKI